MRPGIVLGPACGFIVGDSQSVSARDLLGLCNPPLQ